MNSGSIHRVKFVAPLAIAIASMPFSIALCHFSLIAFGMAWVMDGHWEQKLKLIYHHPIVLPFVLFFVINLIGVAYSDNQHAAWFNIEKKAFLFFLPLLLVSVRMEKGDTKKLLSVFVLTCVAATLICLGVAFDKISQMSPSFNIDSYSNTSFYSYATENASAWRFLSYSELASGIGMHPSYLSLYLVFCFLLLIHFYATSSQQFMGLRKILLIALLTYLGIFILLLSTRIMILAFLIISIYGLNVFLKKRSIRVSVFSSIVFVLIFSGIVYLNPISRFRNYQEIVSTWPYLKPGVQSQSTTIRASLWSLSVKSLPKINWAFGIGTGDVEQLITETGKRANISNVLSSSDPHNQYLQTLLGLGIVGLGSLIACLFWPALVSYQTGNFLYVGFIFLFSMLCLTETALELQKGVVFFSLFSPLLLFHFSSDQLASAPVKSIA